MSNNRSSGNAFLRYIKLPQVLIFLLLLSAGSYFHHPILFSNESCRYYLIMAVVDHHKLYVDDISTEKNDDLSFSNGHYFSAKAIGVPLLGVPVYWFIRNFTPLSSTNPFSALNIYIVRFFVATLPFAVLGIILFNFSRRMGVEKGNSILMVLAYSFGSIALNHATIFSGHQTAASFCFFSFALVFNLKTRMRNNKPSNILYPIIAGLFAGIGALSDYTAMYIVVILIIYIFSSSLSLKNKMFFILGGFPFLLLLALYNLYCFGSIFSFSYSHLTYETFMQGASHGFLGISLPNIHALFSILLSPSRGLFFIMPVFIYSIFGILRMLKNRPFVHEGILIIFIFLGYLFINGGFYGWHAGWTYGPRYLVPMLPFLAIPMVFSPQRSIWFLLLILISAFQVMTSVAIFFHISEEIINPLFEVIAPLMSEGFAAINLGNLMGLKDPLSLLPLFVILTFLIIMLTKQLSFKHNVTETVLNKFIPAILAFFIIFSLSSQSTIPPKKIHCFRAHILKLGLQRNILKKGINALVYEEMKCNSQ